MKKTFKVLGMSCMHCQKAVQKALENNENIYSADVSLESGEVTIECDENLTLSEIEKIINEAGYKIG